MSMKKAIDQTIRDLKRGVNKKVLKVPSIEQKVLDATSNEPWGPHGSLLADIAQATRNYHEYQMIMAILWKRINDTGKNWRHVYKALTVLEYMVSHGSERVIDDIREHAYQIATLSDFQYIDSSGRDQGNNVRRKSQILVALVNDKEMIQEVREKAATNRDKFRSSSAGGMYRPGSGGYGDDRYEGRYGGRDDDRNGYGRERDGGFRDDERYGRYGDSYNREGDRYGRDYEDHYGRDSYQDDSRGRTRSEEDYQYGSRSKSSDRVGGRAYDEDDRRSTRGGSVRADDNHNVGRRLERNYSEQNLSAPPSYEEAVNVSKSPTYSERDGETPTAQLSSPTAGAPASSSSPSVVATTQPSHVANDVGPSQATVEDDVSSHSVVQANSFDEFDPRGSVSATASTMNNAEMDLLGSLADAFSPGPLAIMPASPSNSTFTAVTSDNTAMNQSFEDPFGDSPFRAIPSDELAQPHNFTSTTSFHPSATTFEHTNSGAYNPRDSSNVPNFKEQQSQQPNDMLAGILPPSSPFATSASQTAGQPPAGLGYAPQSSPFPYMASQNSAVPPGQLTRHSSLPYSAPSANSSTNVGLQAHNRMSSLPSEDFLGGLLPQGPSTSEGPLALVLHQSEEKKFETKSTVWADTLNRGLVNLNISGSKINPLSDIGIDFESLNRKEKRMEKPSMNPATSNVSMGKAMGSGSGIGRAGVLRPTQNQMMGPGMGMGMGMGMGGMNMGGMGMAGRPGVGMGMNYGPVNATQPPPMGMGMGTNMGGMGVNMGMGMGLGQGGPMQPPHGSNMGGYPMMGRGGYPPQQPYQYGGRYR